MKKSVFLMFGIILFLTFHVYSQDQTFYNIPAIYRIDDAEKELTKMYYPAWTAKHGTQWLDAFYSAWEAGPKDKNYAEIMATGSGYKRILDGENLSFIINGWLYVISYEPNTLMSHLKNDYAKCELRKAWLYRKNIKTGSDWELAFNRPVCSDAINNWGIGESSFRTSLSAYNISIGGKSAVYKLQIYEGAILILCGVSMTVYENSTITINRLLVLCPFKQKDGSFMYDLFNYGNVYSYPEEITEVLGGGSKFNLIDNLGHKQWLTLNFKPTADGMLIVTLDGYIQASHTAN